MSEYVDDISSPSSHGTSLKLVRCPACDKDLEDETQAGVRRHLEEHDPEEFGLTATADDPIDDQPPWERALGGDR